jgi:anti-sigma factor RsiW
MEVFDLYVELEVAGQDPATRYPAVANHIAACPDCREDHEALVALVRSVDDLADA